MGRILYIHLLGEFRVIWNDVPIRRFDTNKARALLAYLAMGRGQRHSREVLAEMFWPDVPTENALRNLRLTLHRLKRTLEVALRAEEEVKIFRTDRATIQLDPDLMVWVDALKFQDLMTECADHSHENGGVSSECAQRLAEAVDLYRDAFLRNVDVSSSSSFEEWMVVQRERFHRQTLEALTDLGRFHLKLAIDAITAPGRQAAFEKAIQYSRRALLLEPWQETCHQTIMSALAMTGQVPAAIAQYRICCQVLVDEFEMEPGVETTQLYKKITSKRGLGVQETSKPSSRGNLRAALTSFIGREAQADKLSRLIFAYRWVTLVGEGGIGKTRLVQAVAETLIDQFEGGIWQMPLETHKQASTTRAEIHHTIKQMLIEYLPFLSGTPDMPADRLFSQFGSAKRLIILDSFEYFSDGADIILELLNQAPQVRVVITTRQALYFQAGYIMRLEGLVVPEENEAEAANAPAVQLFIERACSAGCEFDAGSPEDMRQIIQICDKLNGNPLAIELAAPWATRMTLAQINENIEEDPIVFPASLISDIPSRHSSMREVFESSWALLSEREQAVLKLCATLEPEFTFADVFALDPLLTNELDQLADKSMLARMDAGRYQILEILRRLIRNGV